MTPEALDDFFTQFKVPRSEGEEITGPAVLIDSGTAGAELGVEYPNGGGVTEQGPVLLPTGSWMVRQQQENRSTLAA